MHPEDLLEAIQYFHTHHSGHSTSQHSKDQITPLIENFEHFKNMQPKVRAALRYEMSKMLSEWKNDDLLKVVLLISRTQNRNLEVLNFFLELVVERYETEIEMLNSQDQSYQFRDPRAFLKILPPPKQEEISLPFDVQQKDDCAFKSHTEDAVIKSVKDADSLPVMEGLKE